MRCGVWRWTGATAWVPLVAAFEVVLVAVGGEHLGGGHGLAAGDEREAAVAGGIAGHDVFVDVSGDAVVGEGDLAVAGVVAGPAAFLLAEGLHGSLFDLEADPARGAGVGEGGDRRSLGGRLVVL